MVTHRDKKPYECSFTDCDKSYCDMRSLRRHLENHHTANGNGVGDSRTPGSGSPSLNCNEKLSSACNTEVSNEHEDSQGNLSKLPVKGRPPKDKSDHLQVSGYDSGRSSGRSTPGSTHEPSAPRERPSDLPLEGPTLNALRERNSDSFSSTASEDGVGNSAEQSVPEKVTDVTPTPHSAVDLLKQAADRVKGQQTARSTNEMWQERFQQQQQQQQPYMVYHPDGTSYQQWYPAVYTQDPRFVYQYHSVFPSTVYQVPVNPVSGLVTDSRQRMISDSDTPPEMTKTVGVPTQATPSPSQEYRPTEAMQVAYFRQQGGRLAGTPTDPTAVAVATAKEMGHYRYAGESYYGVHPSGTQWQPVSAVDFSYNFFKFLLLNVRLFFGGSWLMVSVHVCVGLWIKKSGFKSWLGSLCCVLGQDTQLLHCLSLARSKWVPVNCQGNPGQKCWAYTFDGLASHPGE